LQKHRSVLIAYCRRHFERLETADSSGDDSKDRYRDRYLREKRIAQKSGMPGVLEMLNWRFGHERTLGLERSVCTAALAGGQLMPANQVLISSHGKLLRSRAVVMSVAETPGR